MEGAKLIGDGLVSSVVSCINTGDLQFDLLKEVSSSFVWETVDAALKINVASACVIHVEKQLADLNTRQESLPDSTEERFRIAGLLYKMLDCSKFFILSVKILSDPRQENVVEVYFSLLSKLPALVVMHLTLDIYETESKNSLSLKDFPILLDWYRAICKMFLSQDIIAAMNDVNNNHGEKIPSNIVKCLLWLNDEQTWKSFSQEMCRFTYQNNPFVKLLSSSKEMLDAIVDSTLAFDAFVIIMDHWTKQLTTLKEPVFNWKQTSAVLPDKESMVYSDLSSIEEARYFAAELEMEGRSNGFSVKITPKGNRSSGHCTISKNRSLFSSQLESFRANRLEMQKLSKVFKTMQQKRHASK